MNVIGVDEVLEFANLIFRESNELILFNAVVEIADDRLVAVTVEGDEAVASGALAGEYALFGIGGGNVYFASYSLGGQASSNGNFDDLKSAVSALPDGGAPPDLELLDDLAAAGARTIAVLLRSVNDKGERLGRLYHHPLITAEDAGAFIKDAMKQYEQKPPPN